MTITVDRTGFSPLDRGALFFAAVAIGVAVSPIMVQVGTSGWVVMAAAILVFSGTGELAYASVIASGGGLGPALAASLLVSSRFALLAMSMNNRWPTTRLERILIAHYASEPAVAAALEAAPRGQGAARTAFWQLAFWMAVGWILGSGVGLVIGSLVKNIKTIGLDAVFPSTFVAAILTAMRRPDTSTAALLGGVAAVALTPVLPAGMPVLLAALAAPVALFTPDRPWAPRRSPPRSRRHGQPPPTGGAS
jgi:predicted branched-subunit amino acid permease